MGKNLGGRPLKGEKRLDSWISCRIDDESYNRIKKICTDNKIEISDYFRKLVNDVIETDYNS